MNTSKPSRFSFRRCSTFFVLGTLTLCVFGLALSALSNSGLPQASPAIDRLTQQEKDRLAEAIHLRQELGGAAWPGFGEADFSLVLYNEEFAFLVNYPGAPPDGWYKVPGRQPRGGVWEVTPGDSFLNQPYYRQRLAEYTPEAFTVQVGEQWAPSFTSKEWMEIKLRQQIQDDFGPLSTFIPFRLVTPLFTRGSDGYISYIQHESFHAFTGLRSGGRLEAAEKNNLMVQGDYPWHDSDLQADWQSELELLVDALKEDNPAELHTYAAHFLEQRALRRMSAGLTHAQKEYEQQREWEEGLARYIELELWRMASLTRSYTPLPGITRQADFKNYHSFNNRWTQELDQMKRMADDEGDGRFYYSGMAQAYLLDALLPGWKSRAFAPGVYLDVLLAEAIAE